MSNTPRVLIVDDSAMVRSLHEFIFQGAGFDTVQAESGYVALEALHRCQCDLAVVDINMPLMDGLTLVRRIRSDPATQDMPIIIVTTEQDDHDRQLGFEAGANVYVVKPTEPALLLAHARMLVGSAGRSQT